MAQPVLCILYSPGPVPAILAHRMGIWSNLFKNGLIQNMFKIFFCILGIPSNTLGLDATFSC